MLRRKKPWNRFCVVCAFVWALALPWSAHGVASGTPHESVSLKNEVQRAIDRGLQWLEKQQAPLGFWSQPEHPALTALVLTAYMGEPSGRVRAAMPETVQKGYEYIFRCVQPDGGIYVKDLPNYNTAVSMMALVAAYNPSYESVLRRARNYLVSLQWDFEKKGETDHPMDGGIGYGSKLQPDMSNTMMALEALHYTKFLTKDLGEKDREYKELNWQAVRTFIQRCQNLRQYNDQPWASDDPANKGGFVYLPGESKAGEVDTKTGKKALRSYGSISYAGLLSYIYAEVGREDPRVRAVVDWLQNNYTLEENPGMGAQGLYYYYHTMAKALTAAGIDTLSLADGRRVNWRKELTLKLLNLQREDGSWVNDNGRWWERDPVLVTAYAALTLEILYRGL